MIASGSLVGFDRGGLLLSFPEEGHRSRGGRGMPPAVLTTLIKYATSVRWPQNRQFENVFFDQKDND